MTARDSSFHETFSNVLGKKILGRYGDVDDDFELYLDLYIALTVLEKLEASYSKSLLSMEEYEEELSLAVNQCFKCHALIQPKFPTFTSFVNTYKDNEMMFKRALVQLEGKDLLLGKPGFPVSEQTTAAHILVIFERCGEIKEAIEVYEDSSTYLIQVGKIRELMSTLMCALEKLDGAAYKLPSVQVMRDWVEQISRMESRSTIDSQKLRTDVITLRKNLMGIAHAFKA
ncbi:hypothetical protein M9435_002414 [Picochlorum sp. BPE23]|nr:hypothetical protein M9435_002414 [Picochlorum sp. BPE23]|mmetsp:Transcript_1798/g.3685  ORF Transcript_1798/g.3685 Transcript_1798/m.3685 type:complete len:229 (+) Transcript_1798:49-735(+)